MDGANEKTAFHLPLLTIKGHNCTQLVAISVDGLAQCATQTHTHTHLSNLLASEVKESYLEAAPHAIQSRLNTK